MYVVQLVKCRSRKNEDLSLDPQYTHKEPDVAVTPTIPALWRRQNEPISLLPCWSSQLELQIKTNVMDKI